MTRIDANETVVLPSARVDPRHPLQFRFTGTVAETAKWTRREAELCHVFGEPPRFYFYLLGNGDPTAGGECVYYGITRNPHIRFQQHRRAAWWKRVTHIAVDYINCREHGGPMCKPLELHAAALRLEAFFIDKIEPTENLALGRY